MSDATDPRRDDRGAILVSSLFMATFVVGLTWYVAGVGDGIATHEAMQDAADSSAFTSSVLHARGMNVIGLANLAMTAILAVLVCVKAVQILLMAANVAACAIPFNPLCPLLSSWESPMSQFVRTTDTSVSTVERGLYAAESATAKVMPIVAAARAREAGRGQAPLVSETFSASLSMVPGALEGGPGATRFGLPVEDEDYAVMCGHAARELGDVLFRPLKFLPGSEVIVSPIKTLVGGLMSRLVAAAPQYFCGGGGVSGLAGLDADLARELGQAAGSLGDKLCRRVASFKGPLPPGVQVDSLGAQACRAGMDAALGSIGGGSSMTGTGQVQKRPLASARLGDSYFASWGFALSTRQDDRRIPEGVRVASVRTLDENAGAITEEVDRALSSVQWAQSEMMLDPRQGGPSRWGAGLRQEASYQMRWEARLRRVHVPEPRLRGVIAGSALTLLASRSGGSGARTLLPLLLGSSPEALARQGRARLGVEGTWSGVLH